MNIALDIEGIIYQVEITQARYAGGYNGHMYYVSVNNYYKGRIWMVSGGEWRHDLGEPFDVAFEFLVKQQQL